MLIFFSVLPAACVLARLHICPGIRSLFTRKGRTVDDALASAFDEGFLYFPYYDL